MPAIHLGQSGEQQTRWSLFLGIAIWFMHLNLFYGLASLSCVWGWLDVSIAGIKGLEAAEAGITVAALLLMLVVVYLPWRYWRSFQTVRPTANPDLLRDTEKDRRPLTAFVAMLLNSLLCLFILGTFVPIVALNACGQA